MVSVTKKLKLKVCPRLNAVVTLMAGRTYKYIYMNSREGRDAVRDRRRVLLARARKV